MKEGKGRGGEEDLRGSEVTSKRRRKVEGRKGKGKWGKERRGGGERSSGAKKDGR